MSEHRERAVEWFSQILLELLRCRSFLYLSFWHGFHGLHGFICSADHLKSDFRRSGRTNGARPFGRENIETRRAPRYAKDANQASLSASTRQGFCPNRVPVNPPVLGLRHWLRPHRSLKATPGKPPCDSNKGAAACGNAPMQRTRHSGG